MSFLSEQPSCGQLFMRFRHWGRLWCVLRELVPVSDLRRTPSGEVALREMIGCFLRLGWS